MVKYKNKKTDLKHREVFCIIRDGVESQEPTPSEFYIQYYTPTNEIPLKVGRINGVYKNCKPDGVSSVIVTLPLSRHRLGVGPLFREVTIKTPDADFEGGIRIRCIPGETGIVLWEKPSFDDVIYDSKIIL